MNAIMCAADYCFFLRNCWYSSHKVLMQVAEFVHRGIQIAKDMKKQQSGLFSARSLQCTSVATLFVDFPELLLKSAMFWKFLRCMRRATVSFFHTSQVVRASAPALIPSSTCLLCVGAVRTAQMQAMLLQLSTSTMQAPRWQTSRSCLMMACRSLCSS